MRRSFGLALAALLALGLLAVPAAAAVDAEVERAAGDVLAVEEGEPAGPEPQNRLAPDNPARELAGYENPEVPVTWYASFLLSFAGLVGLTLMIGLYYLRVHRPSQESDGSS